MSVKTRENKTEEFLFGIRIALFLYYDSYSRHPVLKEIKTEIMRIIVK